MAAPRQTDRLTALQGVRGVAALLVVIDHAGYTLAEKAGASVNLAFFAALGNLGVATFFVISGAVMAMAHGRDFATPGASQRFALRRFGRIAPLYWLTTLIYFAKLKAEGAANDMGGLVLSILFVPHQEPGAPFGHPVYGLGWTLQYEIVFYLVFAAALFLERVRGFVLIAAAFVAWSTLAAAGMLGPESAAPAYLGRSIILYFVAGLALGALRDAGAISSRAQLGFLPTLAGALVMLWGAALLALLKPDVTLLVAGSAMPVVAVAFCMLERPGAAPSGKLARIAVAGGDATYSIYLTHSFIVGPLGRMAASLAPSTLPWLFCAACVIIAAPAGWLVYRQVEKPLLRLWGRLTAAENPRARKSVPAGA